MSDKIMKSEEYAELWNEAKPAEKRTVLQIIVHGFLREIHVLIGQFEAHNLEEVMNILEQQQSKWNAMCRKADGDQLHRALFDRILKKYDEPMYEAWNEHLKMKRKRRSGGN